MIARRTFLQNTLAGTIGGSVAAATSAIALGAGRAQAVPNSTGTEPPKLKAPANSCDCHMHIYDAARFPLTPNARVAPTNAAVEDYRLLQKRIGTTRVVIVTPRNYAVDNRATVDAIARFGAANARGVAVVHPTITDGELRTLHAAGVRGIRFSLGDPATAVVTPDMVEPLSKRVADLGWHVQLNINGPQVVEFANMLQRLPSQIVFDHMAAPPLPLGIAHPSHAIVLKLVEKGRTWVKLSGAYGNSKVGPPSYPEAATIAQDFLKAAPERMVWGSDWPHPSLPDNNKPNDAVLFDLLTVWAPDMALRNRILVRNPEALYGFGKPA